MKAQYHAGLSLSVALGVYTLSGSAAMAAASFAAGVFVDADHLFDYLREYGFRPDLAFFFRSFRETLYRRVVLFLHSWEWLALLAAIYFLFPGSEILAGVIIGLGHHLVADQATNRTGKWGYFILYRISQRFVTWRIFPGRGLR